VAADFFVDASGFRSELVGRVLGEPQISYSKTLFCDRAIIGGWPRTDEPIHPYTLCETMDSGWCWQIEHEHWINRGYVYCSRFLDDDSARAELLRKNPKIANEPRLVKFPSFRLARNWVGNVVAIGNASGFVEPLEATALSAICVQVRTVAETLADSGGLPTPSMVGICNELNADAWDDIRDFLGIHYAFNTRSIRHFGKPAALRPISPALRASSSTIAKTAPPHWASTSSPVRSILSAWTDTSHSSWAKWSRTSARMSRARRRRKRGAPALRSWLQRQGAALPSARLCRRFEAGMEVVGRERFVTTFR
jgi:hypothetical protein